MVERRLMRGHFVVGNVDLGAFFSSAGGPLFFRGRKFGLCGVSRVVC